MSKSKSTDKSGQSEEDPLVKKIDDRVDEVLTSKIKKISATIAVIVGILSLWSHFDAKSFIGKFLFPPDIDGISKDVHASIGGLIKNTLESRDSVWITAYQDKFNLVSGKEKSIISDYIPFYCMKGQRVNVFLNISKVGVKPLKFSIYLDDHPLGGDFSEIETLESKEFPITDQIQFKATPKNNGRFHRLGFSLDKDEAYYKQDTEGKLLVECVIMVYGKLYAN